MSRTCDRSERSLFGIMKAFALGPNGAFGDKGSLCDGEPLKTIAFIAQERRIGFGQMISECTISDDRSSSDESLLLGSSLDRVISGLRKRNDFRLISSNGFIYKICWNFCGSK